MESGSSEIAGTAPASTPAPSLAERRIGIVGAGPAGASLCHALVHSGAVPPGRILVCDPRTELAHPLRETLAVKVSESSLQAARFTDVLLFADSPLSLTELLKEMEEGLKRDPGKPAPIITLINPDIGLATLEAMLPTPCPLALAHLVYDLTLLLAGPGIGQEEQALLQSLFKAMGKTLEMKSEEGLQQILHRAEEAEALVRLSLEALTLVSMKAGTSREEADASVRLLLQAAVSRFTAADVPAPAPGSSLLTLLIDMERAGVRSSMLEGLLTGIRS